MDRRAFLIKSVATACLVAAGSQLTALPSNRKTHLFSLSFDDGFARSFLKTAEIYEKYGLKACFNVIASAGTSDFRGVDDYILPNVVGDFSLWNELKQRGHEIMPHGYKHANLTEIPMNEVKDLFKRCMDTFGEKLDDFKPEEAVFNFPFNASNPEVEDWIGRHVMAYRTAGELVNRLPDKQRKRLTCISQGPENIDKFLSEKVDEFLASEGGWFIFNTHGLDGEGWGPMSSGLLDELLSRLAGMDQVAILPVGVAFRQFGI
jgi:peptidoglycan/xylan/chitin deacetylase (PgdA/CDA1 family)